MFTHINKPTRAVISIANVPRPPSRSRVRCGLSFDKTSSSHLASAKNTRSIAAALDHANGGKGMNWFHEIELEVRDYELDHFGVVNNSVYSSYCEHATHKLIDKIGFDDALTLAVSAGNLKYIAPLRKNDKFVLKARIYDYSIVRFYFENLIFKLPNLEPILKSTYTVVVLDKKMHPTRIPPSMISKFNQFRLREINYS